MFERGSDKIQHTMSVGILSPQTRGLPLKEGVPTMVFFSGFPDVFNSFDEVSRDFVDTHHIIVCVMPDYEKKKLTKFLGHSFNAIVDDLLRVLKPVHLLGGGITLVAHDWGSYICQRFTQAHPDMVQKFVVLDVGYGAPKLGSMPIILGYQILLAFCFILSRIPFLGSALAMLCVALYPWKWIGPTPHEYNMPTKPKDLKMFMTYPYFWMLITIWWDKKAAPRFPKTVSTMFVYGTRKRVQFFSQRWLDKLDKLDECEHHALDCGHWIQTQKPKELVALIKNFVKS